MELLAAGNEVYFVGWGTLALLNAGVAQGKNRSGLAWFLISLLLGPLATFLLVALFGKRFLISEHAID
jgi:hypothetical protein